MNKYTLDVPADENDKYSCVRNMMNTLFYIDKIRRCTALVVRYKNL
jgi:hypothetical protein